MKQLLLITISTLFFAAHPARGCDWSVKVLDEKTREEKTYKPGKGVVAFELKAPRPSGDEWTFYCVAMRNFDDKVDKVDLFCDDGVTQLRNVAYARMNKRGQETFGERIVSFVGPYTGRVEVPCLQKYTNPDDILSEECREKLNKEWVAKKKHTHRIVVDCR